MGLNCLECNIDMKNNIEFLYCYKCNIKLKKECKICLKKCINKDKEYEICYNCHIKNYIKKKTVYSFSSED